MNIPSISSVTWHTSMSQITFPEDAVVIADGNLPSFILDALPEPILVEAGESLKTLASIEVLADRVLARRASRPLTIVAVGGGSLGDAVGFLASILWRGVALWHVPTTLLAMVDSAHGGKTAVNLSRAKNQLGTFYLAEKVCIVREVLDNLPCAQREEGLAELIKGLWLDDASALMNLDRPGTVEELVRLRTAPDQALMFSLLKHAVAVKYRVVAQDPTETLGIRTWLNLGHTVAHALELELGLSHGQAVAWGLACMAHLSHAQFGLDVTQRNRLMLHIEPLLYPMPTLGQFDFERFEHLVRRDKKRIGNTLRSVMLTDEASPLVTTDVTPRQWYDALIDVYGDWASRPMTVHPSTDVQARLGMAASKSEYNRALVIAALRKQPTKIDGPPSAAQDVLALRQALAALRVPEGLASIHVGLGGTTLRFALAVAAIRPGLTHIQGHARLWARPHAVLFEALRALGAQLAWDEATSTLVVQGVASWSGGEVRVRCDQSSQYASALALLSAAGKPLTLILETNAQGDYNPKHIASRAYLDMTLALLGEAGVTSHWEGATIVLEPSVDPLPLATLNVHADQSSAAIWRAANVLGAQIELVNLSQPSRQPDALMVRYIARLLAAEGDEEVLMNLHASPDVVPVLVALAVQLPCALRVTNAAHLRLKESNRIEDLVSAMAAVGVTVIATEDGLVVPAGKQQIQPNTTFPTYHDHRFAMAGCLLGLGVVPITIEDPMVVAKSYPEFWHHMSWAGFGLTR